MTSETTLTTLVIAAVLTAIIHTLAGPDHYLPFIAIARSRNYGYLKTILWTFLCGIGHVGSAILLAAGFALFAQLLTRAHFEWLEEWRGNLAAYAMTGMGAAIVLHSLHQRWRNKPRMHRHVHPDGTVEIHSHAPSRLHGKDNFTYWVVFIIFVLGPCETLLPLLTAASVLGTASVTIVTLVFSAATIATMVAAVTAGCFGLKLITVPWLEKFAPELAGGTVMACGLAIVCLGL